MKREEAFEHLTKWLKSITYENDPTLVHDSIVMRCKGCGAEGFLIDGIKHKRGCEVRKAFKALEALK